MVAHSNLADNAPADNGARNHPQVLNIPQRHRESRPSIASALTQTHFRPFRSESDFRIITMTTSMLENSGFYWGPMTVEEAHLKLKDEPLGTFLIRDSRQKDYFYTLSVKTRSGPTSIRIDFKNSHFSLVGSKEEFDCLFKMLEYYIASPKRSLVRPLRKVKVQSLQELCRRKTIETFGKDIDRIPLQNTVLKDYLKSFPFCI
ncbi:SOCS1 protein, partial [Polypterus senegalus]